MKQYFLMRIFVSVAAYREPLLHFTLSRAIGLARDPSRLHFSVIDQNRLKEPTLSSTALAPARLSYLRVDAAASRGACWARSVAMSNYQGEEWFFQIDSHMDFDEGWDERLVAQAQALQARTSQFAISSYPPRFYVQDGRVLRPSPKKGALTHVVASAEGFSPASPLLRFDTVPCETQEPILGFALGAGCLFAPGAFVESFPYDPYYYFEGEEQALALRMYTHGWSIFHTPDLPVYHLYADDAPKGAPPRPLHWHASEDSGRSTFCGELDERSHSRFRALIAGQDLGVFGLGNVRTLDDFAAFSGIDYRKGVIDPRAFGSIPTATG